MYSRRDILRELRSILQFVILDTEFLMCLPPAHHVEVAVGALLVAVLLLGGLHARGSGDPQTLFLVVAPVSAVPVYTGGMLMDVYLAVTITPSS